MNADISDSLYVHLTNL